jgi:hypothetical protein
MEYTAIRAKMEISEKGKKSEERSGEQKVANVRASILPDSGGSKQQKAKKKGPALKDERL